MTKIHKSCFSNQSLNQRVVEAEAGCSFFSTVDAVLLRTASQIFRAAETSQQYLVS